MQYEGSCHCGDIRYTVETVEPLTQAMECNCSHCSRKGYLLTFVPREQLVLTNPDAKLGSYTFNKHVIQHHFCPRCGCAPFGFADQKGKLTAAVNVRCLEGVDTFQLARQFIDGRSF